MLSTLQRKPEEMNLENKILTPNIQLRNYLEITLIATGLRKYVNVDNDKFKSIVTRPCFTSQRQICMTKIKTNLFRSETGLVLRPTVSDHITA